MFSLPLKLIRRSIALALVAVVPINSLGYAAPTPISSRYAFSLPNYSSRFQEQTLALQRAWGPVAALSSGLKTIRRFASSLAKSNGFWDRPLVGLSIAAAGVAIPVSLSLWLGWPAFRHMQENFFYSSFAIGSKLLLLEGATLLLAAFTLLMAPYGTAVHKPEYRIKFSDDTPDGWDIQVLSGEEARYKQQHSEPYTQQARRSGFILAHILSWPATFALLMLSLAWTVFVQLDSPFGQQMFTMSLGFGLGWVITPLFRPGITPALRHYPAVEMAKVSGLTLLGAFILAVPSTLFHDWGHWFVYNLFFLPHVSDIHWSLTAAHFTPPSAVHFSPYKIVQHVTFEHAKALYGWVGDLIKWLYAAYLWGISLFLKRYPILRRTLRLGSLATAFFSLHYVVASAIFPVGGWDWDQLLSNGLGLLNGWTFGTFSLVALLLGWRIVSEKTEWLARSSNPTKILPQVTEDVSRVRLNFRYILLGVASAASFAFTVIFLSINDRHDMYGIFTGILTFGVFAGLIAVMSTDQARKLKEIAAILNPSNMIKRQSELETKSRKGEEDLAEASWQFLHDVRDAIHGVLHWTHHDDDLHVWAINLLGGILETSTEKIPQAFHTMALAGIHAVLALHPQTPLSDRMRAHLKQAA